MGDFQANFRRPKDSGIHTVEGNVAGARAASLVRQREKDQENYEAQVAATKRQKNFMTEMQFNSKFSSGAAMSNTTDSLTEESFRDATVGLVTAEEFKRLQKAKEDNEQGRTTFFTNNSSSLNDHLADKKEEANEKAKLLREKAERKARKQKLKEKRKQLATLSFAGAIDDDDDENDGTMEGPHVSSSTTSTTAANAAAVAAPLIINKKKDPSVNTSFLPDRDRERAARETRERLEQEWKDQQLVLQNESLEIVYSYWDGSGHRRSIQCRKGDTIGMFLEAVRKELANEFRELGNIASDALIYVKEDLMLPHDLTFYDLIVSKARGKSGPLFHFDVHDDVRLGAIDVRVEKEESHPGKIVQRHWYERNKHIFPASRWEHFDPAKEYGDYSIGGKTVQH